MDFHSMKRKQLQALCKKHKIPANLSNLEMANRLTEFFKERENPVIEIESDDKVLKDKKVRFSPENQVIEFTRSLGIKRRSRRNSVYCREGNSSVEIVESGEWNKATVNRRGKAMRTGESSLMEAEAKQTKRGVKSVKCIDGQKSAAADSFDDAELEEGDVVRSDRAMSLKGKMAAEGVENASKRERKRAKCDDKASVSVNGHQEEIVNNHGRVTRSRAQKLTEAPAVEEKRGSKVVKNIGKVAAGRTETDGNRENSTDSLIKRGDEGVEKSASGSDERMKRNGKGLKEILVNKQISEEHVTVEPQLLLRIYKRKANMVGESETLATDARNNEDDEVKGSRKTSRLLTSDGSNVDAVEPQRSNRRKTLVESCLVEKENDVIGKNTRPRRNASKCKPPGPLEKIGGDSNIQKKKVMKRKGGHVSGGDVIKNNNDLNSGAQSSKGSSSVKVVSAAAMQKFADERKQPHNRLDHPNSHHGSSGTGESLFLDVQLSVSKDSESASNLCSKNIISDVELMETHKKKEEVSIADGAGSSCMNLTTGEDLMNSDTNAASKSAEQGTDSSVFHDQNSTTNIVEVENGTLPLEVDLEESIDRNITGVDKNDHEAQVHSQMENPGHSNKINNQVHAEGLNVSGEEGSAETCSSANSLSLGDQTDAETDQKVAETEADEHVQPCVRVIGDHNDLDHLEASSNILDNNNEDTSQTFGEDGAFESCSITRHHGDNVAEGDETFFHKGRASELVEADDDGCLKDHRNASNHLSAFDMPDLSNGERDARIVSPDRGIFADEYSVMNSDMHVAPIAICTNSIDVNLKRDHEEDQITKQEERYIYESTNSEVAETCQSESSKGHKSKCDEDLEFSLNKLSDEEGRYGITPQEKDNFSCEHSVKDFNEQGMSHASPSLALSTMCNNSGDHEANLSARGGEIYNFKNKQSEWTEADESGCLKSHGKSSYSLETNHPPTPSSVSETQEKQKSQLAKSNALANTNQRQGAWSNTSELTGNAVRFLKNSDENISQVLEGLSADEDVNHANYGIDEEASAEAIISDVQSCLISKIVIESLGDVKFQDSVETEHRHKNLLAMQTDACGKATHATSRQSWTETELQNLCEASDKDDHPGLGDTFYQGSETTNMSMSRKKSTASNCGSLTEKQENKMEGESSNECAETKNKNVVLLSTRFDADVYENEFKVLFATPVKIMTPCKTEEAYSDDRVLDGCVALIKECSDAMKENVATESTSNEKIQNVGYEVENNSSIGASLSDNGGDDICEKINEVESFEMLNTSTRVLSDAEYVGCEALKDPLTQNKEEYLDENIPITREDMEEHGIPLVQSCLNDEATNSPRDLYELESCPHMSETDSCKSKAHNKSEGEMTQSTTELSDADLQKFDVLENSHLLTGCSLDGNILRETSIETSSDPEVAINGSSEKDVIEKGISPFLFLKASLDCEDIILESDDQYEAKKLDEEGNPKSSRDISDELHSNSEVAIQESLSIGCNSCKELDQLPSSDELESTCMEAKGMETATQSLYSTDAAAEHGSFVCGAVSGLLSSSAMHNMLIDTALGESLSCKTSVDHKSEQEMSSDAAVESSDADLQKSNISKNSQDVIDEGTNLHLSPKASTVYNELTQSTNADDLNGAKIHSKAKFSQDMPDELHINSKVAIAKSLSDSDHQSEEAELACCLELESMFVETKETGMTTQDLNNIVAPTEHGSPVCGAVSSILSNPEMNLHQRDSSIKILDVGKSVFNMSVGNNKKDIENAEDNSTAEMVQFSIQELHFEENVEDFNNDEEIDNNSESTEENINSLSGTPNNLDKHEGCQDMLVETALGENLSCTYLLVSPKASTVYNELTQSPNIDDLNGAKICDESHINSEVAIPRSLSDSDHHQSEEAGLACCLELESMFLKTGTATHDLNNIVAPTEHGSPVCGAVSSILINSEMYLHLRDENSSIKNLDVGKPVFNMSIDNDKKDSDKAEENSTAEMVQSPIQELHFEENVEDFKNDTPTISNLPPTGYNDILKESDVADTIKEYVDSESSLSVKFENSSASLLSDIPAHTDERIATSKHEYNTPSVDCFVEEIQEPEEATLLTRKDFLDEGTAVKLESADGQSSSSKELGSIMRKNARTILIHGTPGKLLSKADMKENVPTQKSSNVGDITAVRPAKRRALQDLQWK